MARPFAELAEGWNYHRIETARARQWNVEHVENSPRPGRITTIRSDSSKASGIE